MRRQSLTLVPALLLAMVVVLTGFAGQAGAEQPGAPRYFTKKGAFNDVFQDLQDAVINRGLVIDYVGHIDKMLERTSAAAGSITETGSKSPYLHAKYLHFCSAKLTHDSVSANPLNLSICPYVVFAFEAKTEPGKVVVGFRRPVPGPSKLTRKAFAKIDDLLTSIIKEATSG